MPRYLVMVQWGAGIIYPKGSVFTAKDDQQAVTDGGLKGIGLDRKKREGKKGAKPHGILLRVVKDERPEYGPVCMRCNKEISSVNPVSNLKSSYCPASGVKERIVRRQMEGTGPETPYLDLRGEG